MSPEGPHARRLRPAYSPRGSSARGMFVLACFSPTCQVLTAAQIAVRLDLSSATVESLAETLVMLGCLASGPSGEYLLAVKSPSLGVKDERSTKQ
jgi:DNA-binding IclR family transcriptional regulator